MFDEYSTGILQIFTHARWWLLPILLLLLLPIVAIFLKKTEPLYPLILLFAGGLGLIYSLFQGFALGLHGWSWEFLGNIFGETEHSQIGMGYGALLVCSCFPGEQDSHQRDSG